MTPDNPGVSIDEAHAHLLYGLVCAHKPERILEFGFGGGRSAEAILSGVDFNGNNPTYTLVDNWRDWSGYCPQSAARFAALHITQMDFVCMAEGEFVADALGQYDLIMSDADHENTQRWFEDVYYRLLAPGGILIYHDVRSFPNIGEIEAACVRDGLRHVVFDRNSRVGEACQRGLLIIFKGF